MRVTLANAWFATRGAGLAAAGIAPLLGALWCSSPLPAAAQEAAAPARIDIFEYRVEGARILAPTAVEAAVYPFLGPGRTADDVEQARAALEKAYADGGYQTVAVDIPPQAVVDGVVVLKVSEGTVGRLRVRGSRYFSLNQIRAEAPALAEGVVPDFNAVTRDIIGLNQQPDRRVTPTLRAGVAPGTVDVDLNVEDQFPLHGSLELNNRHSDGTTPLRLSAALHYDNLWQLGHSLSLSYQVAPDRSDDGEIYSASYLARFPRRPWLSLLVFGVKNDSDVATLGGTNVVGRGETLGFRGLFTLPGGTEGFFHQLSAGLDYKHFDEIVGGGPGSSAPITYYPVTLDYTANWNGADGETEAGLGLTFNLRGLGSDRAAFDNKRLKSGGDFITLTAALSRSQEVANLVQLFGRVRGQLASSPLVSSEEFSAGGADTVRGYLESEVLGDNGVLGTVELRSPPAPAAAGPIGDWQVYAFADGGALFVLDPLPDQKDRFTLASAGIGGRIRLFDYLNGAVDLGLPLVSQTATRARDPRLHFRLWGAF